MKYTCLVAFVSMNLLSYRQRVGLRHVGNLPSRRSCQRAGTEVKISKHSQFLNVLLGWEGGFGENLLGPCRQRKHGVLERGAVHIVRAAAHVDDAKSDFDSYDEENETVVSYGYLKAQARGGVIVALEGSEVASEGFLPWQEAPLSLNKKVKKHETMKVRTTCLNLYACGVCKRFLCIKEDRVQRIVVVVLRFSDKEEKNLNLKDLCVLKA